MIYGSLTLGGVQHGQHFGSLGQSSGMQKFQSGYASPNPCGLLVSCVPYALPTRIVAIAAKRTTNFNTIFNEFSIIMI
jgi:hypothetical protein